MAVKIGVVGLGRIGWNFHVHCLRGHGDFAITAVVDPAAERRAEAQAELGCVAYETMEAMLDQAQLDAVVIATPTHLHEAQALAALARGLHVLLEKPIALNSAEAERIVAEATRRRRVLTVYQPHRLAGYFQTLMKVLAEERIGRICRAQIGMFSFARRNDWQSLRRFGGGMLNNYGAHGLDQLLQLVGYDIERSFCVLQQIATLGDTDDGVKIVLQTPAGAIGELDISQASAISPYRLNVWGTSGGIVLLGNTLQLRWFDRHALPRKELVDCLASAGRQYPSDNLDWQVGEVTVDEALAIDVHADFAKAISTGSPPAVLPEETLTLMRLLERLRADAGLEHDFREVEVL